MKAKTDSEWAEIVATAQSTGKMANTLAKALAKRYSHRWKFVDFRGPNGQESAGIVDIIAIRKSSSVPSYPVLKKLDLFDIMLIQVKGGTARNPTAEEEQRLRVVADKYDADAIVLFRWNKEKKIAEFCSLTNANEWEAKTPSKLFGRVSGGPVRQGC
jgi:hypothetical protein